MIRLYVNRPLAPGDLVLLEDGQRHYLLRVMRVRVGQEVVLFNGQGFEWPAIVLRTGPDLQVRVGPPAEVARESPLAITLVQGLARGQAMDWVMQKAVELGVARVVPLICQRGRHDPGNLARWQRIAAEAAEQCGRTRLPELLAATPWEGLAPLLPPGHRFLLWEGETAKENLATCLSRLPASRQVTLLVGPEGGFADHEVARAVALTGCVIAGLGPRILRTETAALTALAALQLFWGDLA